MKGKLLTGVLVCMSLVAADGAAAADFVAPALVTGAGAGGGPHVRGFGSRGEERPISFMAFSGNNGGVRVATADVDGDGTPEILAAPGAAGSEVRIFDGRSYGLRRRFLPYWSWGSGVSVTGGDLDADGKSEVVAGTGPGCCTSARFFSVEPSRELNGFFLFGSASEVGAHVALADFTGDGRAELAALPVNGSASGRVGLYAPSGGGTPFRAFQVVPGETRTALAAGDVLGDRRAEVVVSSVVGQTGQVKVVDAASGNSVVTLVPFVAVESRIAVAVGDVDGDGRGDVVAATSTSDGLAVRAFDATGKPLASFYALDGALRNGVSLAADDLDGDGKAEIVLGTGPTMGEPRIAVFDGVGRSLGGFSYDEPFFTGGVRVSLGDVLGGERPEVVTASGPGRAAEIRIFDPEYDFDGNLLRSWFPFGASYAGGLSVAAADGLADRRAEIVAAPAEGEPRVKVFDGDGRELSSFLAFEPEYRGGVLVAAGDLDADGKAEIVAAKASGPTQLRVFEATGAVLPPVASFSSAAAAIAVADLAGDGRGEVLLSGQSLDGIVVWDPSSGALDEVRAAGRGARLAALDLDGDGRQEIVAAAPERLRVVLLRGDRELAGFSAYPWSTVDVFVAAEVPTGPALAIDNRRLRTVVGSRAGYVVASFQDSAGRSTGADFGATVDWGDGFGPVPAGIVPRGNGRFEVTSRWAAVSAGTYRLRVQVTDARGRSVQTTSTMTTAPAPLRASARTAAAVAGRRARLVLGRVRDLDVASIPQWFRVAIAWGDGTRTAGALDDRGDFYDVVGTHRYGRAGVYRVTATITAKWGKRRAVIRTSVRVR